MKFETKVDLKYIRLNAITVEEILQNSIIIDIPYTRPDLFCETLLQNKINITDFNIKFKKLDYVDIILPNIEKKIEIIIITNITKEGEDYLFLISKMYSDTLIYIKIMQNKIYLNIDPSLCGNFVYTLLYLLDKAEVYCNYKFKQKKYKLNLKKYTNLNLDFSNLEQMYYTIKNNIIIPPYHRQDIVSFNFILADLLNLNFEKITFKKSEVVETKIIKNILGSYLQNKNFKYILPNAFVNENTYSFLNLVNENIIINPISKEKAIFTTDLTKYLLQKTFEKQNNKSPIKIYTKLNSSAGKIYGIIVYKNDSLENILYDLVPLNSKINIENNSEIYLNTLKIENINYKFYIHVLKDIFIEKFKYRTESTILLLEEF